MPVDRRLREELVHVLAAHLRERMDRDELLARLKRIHDELAAASASNADQAAIAIADEILVSLECGVGFELGGTSRKWELQRRRAAFLLSDLSQLPSCATWPRGATSPRVRGDGWRDVLLLAMLLSLAAWPWANWYAFAACWLISPLIWLLATFEHHGDPSEGSWPFESEEQWLAHQPLLAPLKLPWWEDSPHYRRPLPRWWRATAEAVSTAHAAAGRLPFHRAGLADLGARGRADARHGAAR